MSLCKPGAPKKTCQIHKPIRPRGRFTMLHGVAWATPQIFPSNVSLMKIRKNPSRICWQSITKSNICDFSVNS